MTTIDKLPAGVRIQLVSISDEDAHYDDRKELEGKNFVSKKENKYYSTWFVMENTDEEYCFYMGTTYKIIK